MNHSIDHNIYIYKSKLLRMEEQVTVPVLVTFQPQNLTQQNTDNNKKVAPAALNKHSSQPKFKTFKEEILKIPKVKQILNKDKHVYNQDIQKRLQLIGSVKNDHFTEQQICDLHDLRKKVQKKTKRHKTNFKIPLTRNNIQSLNNLLVKHIEHNQILKNEEAIFLGQQYVQNAPFDLEQLKFIDKLDKVKSKFSEKYPELNTRVLSKNKLTLENVILNRNIRREMKLDAKKKEKEHARNVLGSISADPKAELITKIRQRASAAN